VVNDRGVKREDTLDADTEAYLAYGDRFPNPAVLTSNNDALENL